MKFQKNIGKKRSRYIYRLKGTSYKIFNINYFMLNSFKPRNVPATFFPAIFLDFHFFQGPAKEPERPYDQNDGSFAPRSLI